MKTKALILLTLSLLFATTTPSPAKDALRTTPVTLVMAQYGSEEGIMTLNLHGVLLSLGKTMLSGTPLKSVSKGIKQLSILASDEVPMTKISQIEQSLSQSLKTYQILVQTRDEDEKVSMYARESEKQGYLSEVVMVLSEKNELMVLSLIGEISMDEISKALEQAAKN